MSDPIDMTAGSDGLVQFAFQNSVGVALPITSPEVIEATGSLSGRCTATLVDGPNGLASITIEGTLPMQLGVHFLRLRAILADGTSLASTRLLINVI